MDDDLKPLSSENRIILDEYLKCWNQTAAYQVAHPKVSATVARTLASRLFANDNMRAHVRARLDQSQMSADEALQRIADIARADIADVVDDDGYFDFEKAKRDGKTRLIKKIRRKTTTTILGVVTEDVEFEMYDAHAANRDILRVHGKFIERSELTGKDGKDLFPTVTVIEIIKSQDE